jgi:outer membrane protein assembly factor BamB
MLLLACAITSAGDWPQWRGPNRTGHVPEGVAVPTSFPAVPEVVWKKPVGFGISSPIVAGGKLFYLDDQKDRETVHAVEAASGKDIWSADLDAAHHDSQSAPGPRTTPLVDGDLLFAQSCRGQLKCFNAADGKVVWQTNYVKDFKATYIGEKGQAQGASRHGYTATPLVDGGHLIAEAGGPGASVVCFDKKTGAIIWKSQDDIPGYSSPIIATVAGVRQYIAFTVLGAMGLDPASGKLLWRVPIKTGFGRHAITPTVDGNIVVVSSFTAGLIGIKVDKSGDSLSASMAWDEKGLAINFASPVIVDHYLYGVGPRKNLECVDVETGKQAWSKDDFFSSNGGKAYAGMIVMGKEILILSDNGQLFLIAADSKEFHEISRTQGCGTNWCIPAYADGKLYLRDAKEMRCLQLLPG